MICNCFRKTFRKDAIGTRTRYEAEEVCLHGYRMALVAGDCCNEVGQVFTCTDNGNLDKSVEV